MNFKDKSQIVFYVMCGIAASFLLSLVLLQLFFFILILCWVFEPNSEKKKAFGKIEIYFLVFVFVRILSILFSEHFSSSVHALYKDALFYVGFYPLVYYLKTYSKERKTKLLLIFLSAALLVSLIGITKFVLEINPRAESIVSGYATFSTYLLTGLAIYFSFFNELKNKIHPWILSFGGVVILLAIILALGRADLAIAIAVLVVSALQKKMPLKYLLPILGLTAALSFFSFQQNSSEIKVRVNKPAALSDRDVLWKTAFELSGQHPALGFGPRTFDDIFFNRNLLEDKDVGGWHNDYLTVYLESGILGLTVFLFLFAQIMLKGFKQFLFADNWKWGILVSLTALFFSAGMSGFMNNPILSLLFIFHLAFFSSELERRKG